MSGEPDLLASFWTIAGNRLPHEPPLVARFPLEDRIAAAARAGFTGIGFSFDDAADFRTRHDDAALRRMFADAGQRWIELEALMDWFADGERRAVSDRQRAIALDQARALGAFQIKVAGDLTGDSPLEAMAEAFAGLCREASRDGVRMTIELLPFSNLASVERGRRVVELAGEPNGGLMFDAWHVARGHIPLAEIASLPPGLCAGVELDDGPVEPESTDFYDDTVMNRRLPGEGAFDLPGLVAAARSAGFTGPYGVEILSPPHRARSLDDAATASFNAARNVVLAA